MSNPVKIHFSVFFPFPCVASAGVGSGGGEGEEEGNLLFSFCGSIHIAKCNINPLKNIDLIVFVLFVCLFMHLIKNKTHNCHI